MPPPHETTRAQQDRMWAIVITSQTDCKYTFAQQTNVVKHTKAAPLRQADRRQEEPGGEDTQQCPTDWTSPAQSYGEDLSASYQQEGPGQRQEREEISEPTRASRRAVSGPEATDTLTTHSRASLNTYLENQVHIHREDT